MREGACDAGGAGELERSREAGEPRAHDGDIDALALSEPADGGTLRIPHRNC